MRDSAIVATAFGEFLIRGTLSDDMRHLGSNALKRQALPAFAANWVEPEERAQRLKIMEDKLQAMNGG